MTGTWAGKPESSGHPGLDLAFPRAPATATPAARRTDARSLTSAPCA